MEIVLLVKETPNMSLALEPRVCAHVLRMAISCDIRVVYINLENCVNPGGLHT